MSFWSFTSQGVSLFPFDTKKRIIAWYKSIALSQSWSKKETTQGKNKKEREREILTRVGHEIPCSSQQSTLRDHSQYRIQRSSSWRQNLIYLLTFFPPPAASFVSRASINHWLSLKLKEVLSRGGHREGGRTECNRSLKYRKEIYPVSSTVIDLSSQDLIFSLSHCSLVSLILFLRVFLLRTFLWYWLLRAYFSYFNMTVGRESQSKWRCWWRRHRKTVENSSSSLG